MKVTRFYLLVFFVLSILMFNFYIDNPNHNPHPIPNAPPSDSPLQSVLSLASRAAQSVPRLPDNFNRLANQISGEVERAPEKAGIAAAEIAYPVAKAFVKQSLVHLLDDVSSLLKNALDGMLRTLAMVGSQVHTHGSLRGEPVAVAELSMSPGTKSAGEEEEGYIEKIKKALGRATEQARSTLKTVQDTVAGAVTSFWERCFGEKRDLLQIAPPKKQVLSFNNSWNKRFIELGLNDMKISVKDFASNISASVASLFPTPDFFYIGNGFFSQGFVLPPQGFSGNVGIAG